MVLIIIFVGCCNNAEILTKVEESKYTTRNYWTLDINYGYIKLSKMDIYKKIKSDW